LVFSCTKDEENYEALIQGMIISLQMKVENLVVTGDFELVFNHIKKKYRTKKEKLKHYVRRVCELMYSFNYLNISSIHRKRNQKFDSLVIVASLFNLDDFQNQSIFHVRQFFGL
jgi:ribonuclease HI